MSTPDPYERHRAAFGAELQRVTPRVRHQRRRRAFALGSATVALAGAASAAIVLAPTTGSRLDVVADARAAIDTSPDSIVHFALTYSSNWPQRTIDKRRAKGCRSAPSEMWRATTEGPPRYRVRVPMNPCGVNVVGANIATGAFDVAYADRTIKTSSPADGFMTVDTGLPASADEQPLYGAVGDTRLTEGDPTDPVARIRSLLAQGKLTDAGTVRGPGGRTLRRLTGRYTELRGDPKAQKPWPVIVDYRVDADTFAPVLIATTSRMSVPKDPDARIGQTPYVHRMITQKTRFSTYETIPLTPATEGLLTVTPEPGTKVTTRRWEKDPPRALKPSAAELRRARAVTDAQIKAGTRVRAEY